MLHVPAHVRSVTAAEDRFGALLDAAVDAMIVINVRGEITRFNRAAEALFGYAASEAIGRNVSILMPEPYRSGHDGYLLRYLSTGKARIIGIGREAEGLRYDGSTFPLDISVGEFRGATEHGFVGILRDITLRKRQETQLRESGEELRRMLDHLDQSTRETEELRARLTHASRVGLLGEMVSGIAHEVNQPLTAIANYANACRRLIAAGEASTLELTETLEKISAQADRAGQVIRGLRSLLRKRDVVREQVDCTQLIGEVLKMVDFELRQSGFSLIRKVPASLPMILGDPVQIQQVVLNLVQNAMDAMKQRARGESIVIAVTVDDGMVEISVADSGPGIPDEVAQRLFEPFFTTKPQGIGLGLSICRSIAQAHGGELSYRFGAGGQTEFFLRLPAMDE